MSPPGAVGPSEAFPERPGPLKVVDLRHFDGELLRKVPDAVAQHLVSTGLADFTGPAGHVRLKLGIRHVPPSTLDGLLLAVRQYPKEFDGQVNHRRVTVGPPKPERLEGRHEVSDSLIQQNGQYVNDKGTWKPKGQSQLGKRRLVPGRWRRLSLRQAAYLLNITGESP